MPQTKRAIFALSPLFYGSAFIFIAIGLVVSSAGVLLNDLGATSLQTGLIISCFFLGAMSCTIFTHKMVSKLGHIRSYAILTAIFAIAAISHDFINNLILWAFLRFVLGFCYYSIVMIVESWLNAKITNSIRSRVIAFYEIVFYLAFAFGSIIMGLSLSSHHLFLLSAILIIIGLIPLNLLKIKAPTPPSPSRISLPRLYGIVPLALVTAFLGGIMMNGFFSMASLYILKLGFNASDAGIFITIAMVGGFLSHSFFGPFSDKFGRRPSIIIASIIASISSIALYFFTALWGHFTISLMLGIGIFPMYALSLARANDMLLDRSRTVEVSRALLFCYIFGSLLSPLILGGILGAFGAGGFMLFYAAVSAFLALFAIFQKSELSPKPFSSRVAGLHTNITKDN